MGILRGGTTLLGVVFLILTGVFMIGCKASHTGSYDSLAVYTESIPDPVWAQIKDYEGPARRPIIVVHGLLGSKLTDSATGRTVWGNFYLSGFDHEFFRSISHPMQYGVPLSGIHDNIYASEFMAFADIKLFGVNFERPSYSGMLDLLKEAGYVLEGEKLPRGKHYPTLFLFYYDWRRDPVENAARLYDFVLEKQQMLAKVYKDRHNVTGFDVNFDIIAHSMGGLITRYFLMYGNQDMPGNGTPPHLTWAGAEYVNNVAIVGSPNAGYLDTLLEMTGGLSLNVAAPLIPAGVVATLPSYYAMLPSNEAGGSVLNRNGEEVDIFAPEVWIENNWGLADPEQDETLKILLPNVSDKARRREIALEHMTKCLNRARQFSDSIQVQKRQPSHLRIALFAGNAVMTSKCAKVINSRGTLAIIEYAAGDGKVLLSSTRNDRFVNGVWESPIKWHSTNFLPAAHMGITRSNNFGTNLLGFLLFTYNLSE